MNHLRCRYTCSPTQSDFMRVFNNGDTGDEPNIDGVGSGAVCSFTLLSQFKLISLRFSS